MSPGPITISEQRVAVFVDVQNMFYSAKALHQSKIDYSKLLQEIIGDRKLIRAIAYVVKKSDVDQSSFTDALERLGYEIKSKDLRLRPDGTAKGDWDMGIAIDTIAIAPKLDTVVLVSGDGDFAPLLEMLKAHGCRVEVVSFRKSTSVELIDAATKYTAIEESLLFKEKKFQRDDSSGNQQEREAKAVSERS
ncbi:MAG: NYN domain-containing protein [Candidatus Brocadiales bacterium]|nr:NYN domain-containing protein [Candidatus Bathyanammoxibius sp.]MCQ4573748.1 NYN domain-containing protein [Candidatus Bathyanammoxibius amoris]